MDINWPISETSTVEEVLNALTPDSSARAIMVGDHASAVIQSGQSLVLIGDTFILKVARDGSDNAASVSREAALFGLFTEYQLGAQADVDLPVLCQTLRNADGDVVGILRSKVQGDDPAILIQQGKVRPEDQALLGHAAARLQAGLRKLGVDISPDHPALRDLQHMRPRVIIDELNPYAQKLVAGDPAIAEQLRWANNILQDRAAFTQGDATILVEGDLHFRNCLLNQERNRVGFMDFGRCGWTSVAEVGFKRLASCRNLCRDAVDEYDRLSAAPPLDRELIVALSIADELAGWGPQHTQADKPHILNNMRQCLRDISITKDILLFGNVSVPPRPASEEIPNAGPIMPPTKDTPH